MVVQLKIRSLAINELAMSLQNLRSILVRNGQRVRKGHPLIALDPTFSSADLTQAQTALDVAMLDAADLVKKLRIIDKLFQPVQLV